MNCKHFWRIETPNGPTCRAICLSCGSELTFNSASDKEWATKSELAAEAA